ncbi:hypothetical protein [Streptomyces sp. NPDC003952]
MRDVVRDLAVGAPWALVAGCLLMALFMVVWVVSLGIVLKDTRPHERAAILREHARLMRFWRRRG